MSAPSAAAAGSLRPVLIVDDETGVRELMARWLETGGYDVRDRGQRRGGALARARSTPPAVALCDIRMPGHDGLWLAQRIRDDAPETAVIMATGVQDVGLRRHQPAARRHRLPDQAVRPRSAARSRHARPRVARVGARVAALARIARDGAERRAATRLVDALASLLDRRRRRARSRCSRSLTLGDRERLRARLSGSGAGRQHRPRGCVYRRGGSAARSSRPRCCTISASWRCPKRCCASRRR